MVPNLKAKYNADVAPALMKKFQYKSTMQIPTIDKIVINVGCGKEANGNSKVIESVVRDITAITGQHPIVTHARKSVAVLAEVVDERGVLAEGRVGVCRVVGRRLVVAKQYDDAAAHELLQLGAAPYVGFFAKHCALCF